MKHAASGMLIAVAFLVAGCAVPGDKLAQVHAGMSRDQVRPILGEPEGISHAPGKECTYYTVLKEFWHRTPWSLSDRYYVCFTDGKVDTFGRAEIPGDQ